MSDSMLPSLIIFNLPHYDSTVKIPAGDQLVASPVRIARTRQYHVPSYNGSMVTHWVASQSHHWHSWTGEISMVIHLKFITLRPTNRTPTQRRW
jgi:hypothetical protein